MTPEKAAEILFHTEKQTTSLMERLEVWTHVLPYGVANDTATRMVLGDFAQALYWLLADKYKDEKPRN